MKSNFELFLKKLFQEKNIRPLKSFGQNFVISEKILEKVIESANLCPKDIVLEIGAGPGNLTKKIARRVKKVIAVEKDKRMIAILEETLKNFKNVKIIEGDALEFEPKSHRLRADNYKLIGNLPYYITSAIIKKFLETENRPSQMVLMIQKEVAQRICSQPPKMNLLALSVQFYAKPRIIAYISKNCFWPKPKVDSAIIKLNIKGKNLKNNKDIFFKIIKAGFAHPRKQLANNLSSELKLDKERIKSWLLKNKINPSQRAETLKEKDWLNLTQNFAKNFQKYYNKTINTKT